jgi:glycosyltransferase involved in cell wall biosynthesis
MTNIAVIIPALNEADNIGPLVQELMATQSLEIIVVDNGSSDATAAEARRAGAKVIHEPRRGYGYACAAGAVAAQAADILVFMDADNSFLPNEMPRLLAPILAGKADLVLGARHPDQMEQGAMPFQ